MQAVQASNEQREHVQVHGSDEGRLPASNQGYPGQVP